MQRNSERPRLCGPFKKPGSTFPASSSGTRPIVLDGKVRGVNLVGDLEEDVLRLRELLIPPRPVLVMVLHAQDDAATFRVLERTPDAFERPCNTFLTREAGIPLSAQGPAM